MRCRVSTRGDVAQNVHFLARCPRGAQFVFDPSALARVAGIAQAGVKIQRVAPENIMTITKANEVAHRKVAKCSKVKC